MTGLLEENMVRYEAQSALFAQRPSRLAIQAVRLETKPRQRIRVNVWRNHALEPILSLCKPFLSFGNIHVDFRLSDYDDTFMFASWQPADVELLWLDSGRYLTNSSIDDWLPWIRERLRTLRGISSAPLILATWIPEAIRLAELQQICDVLPATFLADLAAVAAAHDLELIDPRSAIVAGTPIRNAVHSLIARKLACHWIPAAVLPPIKALALDLDNTLHAGVLGEDGVGGVQMTEGHRSLQLFAKELKARGVFLALVSRNEPEDVATLFEQRNDYALKRNDFSAEAVSWEDKAISISRIADALRIAPDSVLFVDDNPGELASVAAQLPQVHTVYANPDPYLTQSSIDHYPGLWRWKIENDDAKRVGDLKAAELRESLHKEVADPADYFAGLQVTLIFRNDPLEQLSRLADLCKKTNQFNLAMRRLNEVEVAERIHRPNGCVTSVQLKDRLADSGVIAVIVAERDQNRLVIEELCVSCRALGRQLEDTMILTAIAHMPPFVGCREVVFRVARGPRNQPALTWLARLLELNGAPQTGSHAVSADCLSQFAPARGVTLQWD